MQYLSDIFVSVQKARKEELLLDQEKPYMELERPSDNIFKLK
jgi:hypothetical protein